MRTLWIVLSILAAAAPAAAQADGVFDASGATRLVGAVDARVEDAAWWGGAGDGLSIEAESARGAVYGSRTAADGEMRVYKVLLEKWETPVRAAPASIRIDVADFAVLEMPAAAIEAGQLDVGVASVGRYESLDDRRDQFDLEFEAREGEFVLSASSYTVPQATLVLRGGTFSGDIAGEVGTRIEQGGRAAAVLNQTFLVLEIANATVTRGGGTLYASAFEADVRGEAEFPAATGILREGETWSLAAASLLLSGEFRIVGFPRESPPAALRGLCCEPGGDPRYVIEGRIDSATIGGEEVLRTVARTATAGLVVTWFALWLYSRIPPRDLLAHPARAAIVDRVRGEPGIQQERLQALVGLPAGTFRYHLFVLERSRHVRVERSGRYRLLLPAGASTPPLAALRVRGKALDVYEWLAENPGASASEAAASLGLTRQLVGHHLLSLRRRGLARSDGAAWFANAPQAPQAS